MEGLVILALALVIPVILLPAVFIWYLNISGVWAVWKESRARQARREKARKEITA
ncbi:MAG: hypothetical protein JSW16_03590 [Dehalococcoidales bacterium]|nr:MAG: hypothetical protein JSW16_03590 [Dehalococcoidales bacterium]